MLNRFQEYRVKYAIVFMHFALANLDIERERETWRVYGVPFTRISESIIHRNICTRSLVQVNVNVCVIYSPFLFYFYGHRTIQFYNSLIYFSLSTIFLNKTWLFYRGEKNSGKGNLLKCIFLPLKKIGTDKNYCSLLEESCRR